MNQLSILATAAMALLPTMAISGGLGGTVVEPEVAASVPLAAGHDWSGPYAGLQFTNLDGFDRETISPFSTADVSGPMFGVHLGYNHDFGRLVVGGEINYDKGSLDYTFNGADAGYNLDSIASLRVKAGADLGSFLVYGVAGIAKLRTSIDAVPANGPPGSADGHLFGIGAAMQAGDHWMISGEILKQKFGNYSNATITITEVEATIVSLRASYRF